MLNFDHLNLKEIFYNSSDAIFILDKEWRIVAMNHAAEEVSGWSNAEVASMRLCTELFICFGSGSNQLCDEGCPKQSVMITKDPSEPIDVKITAKSGQSVILPGVCVLLPYDNGSSSYAAVIVKNELEKQQLEERLLSGERLDPLTQLYHRQYFEELFSIEAKRAQRHGGFVTLLMIDIERLRDINQKLGNKTGDEVLKGIGKLIRKTIREVDIAGRYGDDEYIILLYGVDEIKAQGFIQRLRENIKNWNESAKLSLFQSQFIEVKLNMCLVVLERDFDGLLERMKQTLDEHKGESL